MSVEAEMHFNRAAIVEQKKQVFAFASNGVDAATGEKVRDMGCGLRQYGDRVEDVHAANFALLDERAERNGDGFDFGEFRHVVARGREENRVGQFDSSAL